METENTGLSAELLAEQQRADRERRKWEAELDAFRVELAEAKRELAEAKTPLAGQSPEPPTTPTAKPRKSTMGNGSPPTIGIMEVAKNNNGNGQMDDKMAKLEAELDKFVSLKYLKFLLIKFQIKYFHFGSLNTVAKQKSFLVT